MPRLVILALCAATLSASIVPVPISAFPPSATLITFNGLTNGTEVNGLNVGGVSFSYTVGGFPLNGAVIIDGGPGLTNNITPPNIVSVGNNTGTLTMILPTPATMFGYGYAILSGAVVANATTMTVFSGVTNLGSLSYTGVPDPNFTGGFAGLLSTSPFDRVAVTFNSVAAPAFALDNIQITPVPEPSTTTVLLLSAAFVGLYQWNKRVRV